MELRPAQRCRENCELDEKVGTFLEAILSILSPSICWALNRLPTLSTPPSLGWAEKKTSRGRGQILRWTPIQILPTLEVA